MEELYGGDLSIDRLAAAARGESFILITGRSGVFRLYVLPLSFWTAEIAEDYGQKLVDLPGLSLTDLRSEFEVGQLIMGNIVATVTVSRGVPIALAVPANSYWRERVEG